MTTVHSQGSQVYNSPKKDMQDQVANFKEIYKTDIVEYN